ncbi:MAG: redox-regulated ATPase YchF [Actinomycetales bacterium]|nr:redox-regulated ATPase YchF [Actinomycetales bacterium]
MALTVGIVGLPNVGKSTLFNALTRARVLAANYPFATIEPNVGVVGVPDPRLSVLARISDSERIVPATVTFVDIAGIVAGASQGEGLGNTFLAHIREADALCQVVRVFRDGDVVHVAGAVSPAADIDTVTTELALADLQTIERALPRLEREARSNPARRPALAAVTHAQALLNEGIGLFQAQATGALTDDERTLLGELFLLTVKPVIYVFNVDTDAVTDEGLAERLRALVAPAEVVILDAKVESELIDLDEAEAAELLSALGQAESGLAALARAGQRTLGLHTFLTAGPKEARAWTIPIGATAPQAAGVIHTDFERGFIKAEVVGYDDLVSAGSLAQAKARGRLRLEGRDYVMADGDVVEFRFQATTGNQSRGRAGAER